MQNQQNTGYSSETTINANNAGKLARVWSIDLQYVAGTPIVYNGVVYVAGPPYVYAVNEKTGTLIWSDGPSRGLARMSYATSAGVSVSEGNVFEATDTNLLVSLNARTGALNWKVSVTSGLSGSLCGYAGPEAVPLVYNNMVIVGETKGYTCPARGVIQAFAESNGKHLWTFYTVPAGLVTSSDQAFYHNSWGTNSSKGCYCGGGTVWNVPAVDPHTGIIYFGTGNPYPVDDPFVREPNANDTNLYVESVIALDSNNGKMVWYHQELKPEYMDWDQGMPVQLFNTTIGGARTEVVGVGGKAGIYFELDARTGALIYKIPVGVHLNDNIPYNQVNSTGFVLYPSFDSGGINTFSSYNFLTNLIYTEVTNEASRCSLASGLIECVDVSAPSANETLYAIDASTGTVKFSINLPGKVTYVTGGVSSADNLIFYADANHDFYAANAMNGKVVWKYHDPTGYSSRWSWGPPAIVDGLVFWTTYGYGKSPGQLIAFGI
jgi:alcohol dehydrogenase (cytochrome c)